MKKLFLSIVLAVAVFGVAQAQNSGRAIGARFGWGAELSYQHPLSKMNRLEFDLGLDRFGSTARSLYVSGIYQWVNPIQDGFNWYIGFGPQLGMVSTKDVTVAGVTVKGETNFALAVAGQIGVEYNIPNVPIQLSLDWRPAYLIVPDTDFSGETVGLGIRYRF